jgi:hypothetical protein
MTTVLVDFIFLFCLWDPLTLDRQEAVLTKVYCPYLLTAISTL